MTGLAIPLPAPATMRAAILDGPGAPETFAIRRMPVPKPGDGEVLIRVMAAGLNQSEMHFRQGIADFGSFPRIPGLEAVGIVVDAPGGEFEAGSRVAALMGGMGRTFDGSYAEYSCVPASICIPFASALDWATLGAVPEMLQTARGSLEIGLAAKAGQTVLVRGATSSVGLAILGLACLRGIRTIATTRSAGRAQFLREAGADCVVLDDGPIASRVRELAPGGVDGAVELVGTTTLRDTLACVARFGTVCVTGGLGGGWTLDAFYPIGDIPNSVRLTGYSGEAADLRPQALQEYLDAVAAGRIRLPLGPVYGLDEVARAHREMEEGAALGKQVLLVGRSDALPSSAPSDASARVPASAPADAPAAGKEHE